MSAWLLYTYDGDGNQKNFKIALTEQSAEKFIDDNITAKRNEAKQGKLKMRFSEMKKSLERKPSKPKEISELQYQLNILGTRAAHDPDYKELFEKKRAEFLPRITALEEEFLSALDEYNKKRKNVESEFISSLTPEEFEIYTANYDNVIHDVICMDEIDTI